MGLSSKQVIKTSDGLDWIGTSTSTNSNPAKQNPSTSTMKRQHQTPTSQPEALNCPRCESSNTKFCYYNNYNKSQPRHFCRACKRHWTRGGTLRNVPVGGGRKNKRPKKSNSNSNPTTNPTTNPTPSDIADHSDKTVSEILFHAMMGHSAQPYPSPTPLVTPTTPSPFQGPTGSFVAETTPWQHLVTSTTVNTFDYSWNFEDIDTLVSPDHIALPWEDSLDIVKP